MRFSHINNVTIIAISSLLLAVLGFALDLHERVQDVSVNIFEILIMTALIFTFLCLLYGINYLIFKFVTAKRH